MALATLEQAQLEKILIGEKEVFPLTIPSGIIMTEVSTAERLLNLIPEIGFWTTKSIGPRPRIVPTTEMLENPPQEIDFANREPIFAEVSPGCYVNAVGLTNPGAEKFREQLRYLQIPSNKAILASIFGKNKDEFVFVAKTLEDLVDAFELNLSCPHTEHYGMVLGQDPKIVYEIVKAVVQNTKIPVFAKLTPNTDKILGGIATIAKAAIEAGAYGIVAINTAGPYKHEIDGHPVLTNVVGGKSGKWIKELGIQRVREIRQAIGENMPIIAMGGISIAQDILEYKLAAEPDAFGIGSALIGMRNLELARYFPTLVADLENETNNAAFLLKKPDMQYRKYKIANMTTTSCDFGLIKINGNIDTKPGQFVFAWLPKIGEKPFSVMDDAPLTLGVLERGLFTKHLNSLKQGDEIYIKGPYGQGVDVPENSNIILIGGGCGIAGLYLIAKKLAKGRSIISILGAKDKQHLPYLRQFEEHGQVRIATEDGSLGRKGTVADLFQSINIKAESYFFNCGPKEMVEAVLPLELAVSSPEKVYSSVDYTTRCGVGICGSCADKKGRRTCVEGPFMKAD